MMVTARRRDAFRESHHLPPLLLPPGRHGRLPLPLRNRRLRAAGGEYGRPLLSVRPGSSFFPLALLIFARTLFFSPAHSSTPIFSATPSPSSERPRGHGSPPAESKVTCLRSTAALFYTTVANYFPTRWMTVVVSESFPDAPPKPTCLKLCHLEGAALMMMNPVGLPCARLPSASRHDGDDASQNTTLRAATTGATMRLTQ